MTPVTCPESTVSLPSGHMGTTAFGGRWLNSGAELLLNECRNECRNDCRNEFTRGGEEIPRALLRCSEHLLGGPLDDVRVIQSAVVEVLEVPAVAAGSSVIVHPSAWAGFDDRVSLHLLVHAL